MRLGTRCAAPFATHGQRLPDFPDKGADDLTDADLKASAYYFVRKEDGSFELTTKPDRVTSTAGQTRRGGAAEFSGQRDRAATVAVGTVDGVTRLHPDEIATGERLSTQIGRPLRESEHVGAEFVDDLGRTYDALGRPAASRFWNEREFFRSIDNHLLKENDFTVVDLTGFTDAQKAVVSSYINALPVASQRRIIRIGF